VETKLGEAVKKRSLKVGKKGDGTRVGKRKARPDPVVDGEANGVGQHDDGLDEEKPLKRARQRVSDSQMKRNLWRKASRYRGSFLSLAQALGLGLGRRRESSNRDLQRP
jgi:hypothetical protein